MTLHTQHRPVRVALIGCGGIAEDHLRGYLVLDPDLGSLAGACDVDHARMESIATRARAKAYDDYAAVLADPDIDAVDICLPHHLHEEAIVSAARAGKHIICEKPLCLTLDEASRIRDAVSRAGVTFMAAHNQLFTSMISRVKAIIDSGAVGRIYHVVVTDTFAAPFTEDTVGWRGKSALSGGGELIDSGYHPTYLLIHLVADEPVRVSAVLPRQRLTFLDGEDTGHVLVEFSQGATGYVLTSWAYGMPGLGRVIVIGEHGTIHSDGKTVTFTPVAGTPAREDLVEQDAFAAEIAHFASAIQTGEAPIATDADAERVLRVVLASYEDALHSRTSASTYLPVAPYAYTTDER